MKSKSIHDIEQKMGSMSPDSFRYRVLEAAKSFKSSWIELGQFLFTVYKDKLFKNWGYLTFEAYCAKEIGIRQNTAMKLLKSYSFLEKEEPRYVKPEFLEERKPDRIPSYESVNALRLAHENEDISEGEYDTLRRDVLEDVKEDAEVKKKIKYILKSGAKPGEKGLDGADKDAQFKRLLQYLENYKNGLSSLDVPAKISKKLDELIEVLQDYRK